MSFLIRVCIWESYQQTPVKVKGWDSALRKLVYKETGQSRENPCPRRGHFTSNNMTRTIKPTSLAYLLI